MTNSGSSDEPPPTTCARQQTRREDGERVAGGVAQRGGVAGSDPTPASAAPSRVSTSTASAGKVLADSGFRPRLDGFPFPNYGADEPFDNLTTAEMLRLFGDAVCVHGVGETCTLTPEAQQWMSQINKGMAGSHCYGFSVLSLALFKHQLPELGPGPTFSLAIKDNPLVQRTIAYAMSQQDLESVTDRRVTGTPDQILKRLIASLTPSSRQTYTLGIYKRDGTGGHAITPFKVVDRSHGTYRCWCTTTTTRAAPARSPSTARTTPGATTPRSTRRRSPRRMTATPRPRTCS
jgi:hypothetical protein